MSISDASFHNLSLMRQHGRWLVAGGTVREYERIYCEKHSRLKYYTQPIKGMVRGNGNLGFLIKIDGGGLLLYKGNRSGIDCFLLIAM
ncbi:MAG: hypothetical protein IPJ20_19650 [Flammeovirgaceae bacterium]|nr:hypothetical protein [Flammeovirgaceae bacterium]